MFVGSISGDLVGYIWSGVCKGSRGEYLLTFTDGCSWGVFLEISWCLLGRGFVKDPVGSIWFNSLTGFRGSSFRDFVGRIWSGFVVFSWGAFGLNLWTGFRGEYFLGFRGVYLVGVL